MAKADDLKCTNIKEAYELFKEDFKT